MFSNSEPEEETKYSTTELKEIYKNGTNKDAYDIYDFNDILTKHKTTYKSNKVNIFKNDEEENDEEEDDEETMFEYFSKEFPHYLTVAIFGKSEDEALEKLIDKAVLDICYKETFQELWNT
eukprot:8790_1